MIISRPFHAATRDTASSQLRLTRLRQAACGQAAELFLSASLAQEASGPLSPASPSRDDDGARCREALVGFRSRCPSRLPRTAEPASGHRPYHAPQVIDASSPYRPIRAPAAISRHSRRSRVNSLTAGLAVSSRGSAEYALSRSPRRLSILPIGPRVMTADIAFCR